MFYYSVLNELDKLWTSLNDHGLVDKLNELGHLFHELNERMRHLVL